MTAATANITLPIPQLKPTPQNHQELQHISDILHLLHHRNRNQHRRSAWYRHFSIFRRHLATLLTYIDGLAEQPTTHLGKHRKKATDAKLHVAIQGELSFWRDVLVPKWQNAFAQVVADGRFAVLGVVLLAAMAQVTRIVGLVTVYEAMGEEEVRRVLEKFARERWVGGGDESQGDEGVKLERQGGNEDFGEKIMRLDTDESEDSEDVQDARAIEKQVRRGESSTCMVPEQEILKKSREALKQSRETVKQAPTSVSASPLPEEGFIPGASSPVTAKKKTKKSKSQDEKVSKADKKRPAKDKPLASSKPLKKKKKNAIDDLFSGL